MSIQEINRIKNHYPAGTRIELISMDDPYDPVPSGTRGTVEHVDDEPSYYLTMPMPMKVPRTCPLD